VRLNPDLIPRLEDIINRALEKDRELRYQTAKEMRAELLRLKRDKGTESLTPAVSQQAAAPTAALQPGTTSRTPVHHDSGFSDRASAGSSQSRSWGFTSRVALLGLMALVVAFALLAFNVGGWRDRLVGPASKPQIRALAVLPLENLSRNPEQEYFADGMTEALIRELGKIGTHRVISRQSVMQYKGSKKSLPEIAEELNVGAVLEGAVEQVGDRVRISIHLEQVSPESQLWA
jgi:TolB-like protein